MKIYLSISNKATIDNIQWIRDTIEEMIPEAKIITYHDKRKNLPSVFDNKSKFAVIVLPPEGNVFNEIDEDPFVLVGKGNYEEADFALRRDLTLIVFHHDTLRFVQRAEENDEDRRNWQVSYGALFCEEEVYTTKEKAWVKELKIRMGIANRRKL